MKIFVTSEHIKRGKTVNAMECPVALALRAAANLALKPETAVYVTRREIQIGDQKYLPAQEVVRFLDEVDNDYKKLKNHQPFSFDLE